MQNWAGNPSDSIADQTPVRGKLESSRLGRQSLILWCKSEFQQFKGRFKAFSLKELFPGPSVGKETACNMGDLGLIPGLGWTPEGGHGYPLQYSCLENPHGQRNLEGCGPWLQRVGHWVTKHTYSKGIQNYADLAKPAAAAAAAKLLQSCPTLCDSRDGSPPSSPVPGILQARTLEWVAISFSNAWKWSRSVVSILWPNLILRILSFKGMVVV